MLRGLENRITRQLWDHPIRVRIFHLFLEPYFFTKSFRGSNEGNKKLYKDTTTLKSTIRRKLDNLSQIGKVSCDALEFIWREKRHNLDGDEKNVYT